VGAEERRLTLSSMLLAEIRAAPLTLSPGRGDRVTGPIQWAFLTIVSCAEKVEPSAAAIGLIPKGRARVT
jgi:hypothetical protein